MEDVDNALIKVKDYRDQGYWAKIVNCENDKKIHKEGGKNCAIYVSKWNRDEQDTKGKPKWN